MKKRTLMIALMVFMLTTSGAFAQMRGSGSVGTWMMGGVYNGSPSGTVSGYGPMGSGIGPGTGSGMGFGTAGSGGIGWMMYGNTISHGYLSKLNPIANPAAARAAIQAFLNTAGSSLQISEIWEYGAIYKAELVDANLARAFDIMVDKFTGAVLPEMGLSMMMNASYGMYLYSTPGFGSTLSVSQAEATAIAQAFVNTNTLGYTLGTPEIYPGYYKFHTTKGGGGLGMDIMVNGYDGGVWMDTLLGPPLGKYQS